MARAGIRGGVGGRREKKLYALAPPPNPTHFFILGAKPLRGLAIFPFTPLLWIFGRGMRLVFGRCYETCVDVRLVVS